MKENADVDENGVAKKMTLKEQMWQQGYTAANALLIVLFGEIYKFLARSQNNRDNYRYQSEYDNVLIARLFRFNMINFYLPMCIVAFYRTRSRINLFIMMLVQMGFKQFIQVIKGWIKPYWTAGKNLK